MKIHVLSDLHLEFSAFVPPDTGADVVVLAGDIGQHTHGLQWALAELRGRHPEGQRPAILYVPGNHEFYHAELYGIRRELQKLAERARQEGIRAWVLDNGAVEFEGVRFLGATLWTDYQLFGSGPEMAFAMREAVRGLYDHRIIRCAPRSEFSPAQALRLHNESAAWLAGELNQPFDGKTVVVTHHLPSMQSVADRFKNDALSAAFASRLDRLVAKADLWIHGHTHDNMDYQLGKCRVVCNPRGYVQESNVGGRSVENPNFDPGFVIDLDEVTIRPG